ncbi:MAG: 50S ribosomal protein L13 [Patescibacteria group bacterium]
MTETANNNNKIYKIDATGRVLGRVASEVAMILRGKTDPNFLRHVAPNTRVEISNASKMKLATPKLKAKTYARYTGYPGGLKLPSLEQVIAKKGYSEPLRLAIKGMLPRNKLRAKFMTKLTISE